MSALYLYERWHSLAQQFSSELAILDHASGKAWTFRELLEASETGSAISGPVAFPQGHSVEFILTLLKAWRANVWIPAEKNNNISEQRDKVRTGPFRHLRREFFQNVFFSRTIDGRRIFQ